jgi:hypothetical protein
MKTPCFVQLAQKYAEFHKALADVADYCWTGYEQVEGLPSLQWKDASQLAFQLEGAIDGHMAELLRVLPGLERKSA